MKLSLDMTRCLALHCPNASRCERFQQRHLRGAHTPFVNDCQQFDADLQPVYPLFIPIGRFSAPEHAA